MSNHDRIKALAERFHLWRYEEFPTWASDAGRHDADSRLADFSPGANAGREKRLAAFRAEHAALGRERSEAKSDPGPGARDEAIDHELLGAAIAYDEHGVRVLRRASRDPQLYVEECMNGIFSLLKKEYAPPPVRLKSATSRMQAMPALLDIARLNLTEPVALYAELAAESVEGAGPLFGESLETLCRGASEPDLAAMRAAREVALGALASFAAWLRAEIPRMTAPAAMGKPAYARFLREVLLLPLSPDEVVGLGEAELARSRATLAWIAPAASASSRPVPPKDQDAFLRSYEAHTEGIVRFLRERRILTVPPETGPFGCRQLPEAFKPTSPGGFMNPPGVFDPDPSGFYFIPAYDPKPVNFFLRAAIEDPRPILAHEGVPGHHLQISIANRLRTPSGASIRTASSSKGGRSTPRRCSTAAACTTIGPIRACRSCSCCACAPRAYLST